MNMFKPSKAKTPEEYIDLLEEPRKSEIQKLHRFIKKAVPKLKPYMQYGIIGYGKMPYKTKSGREGDWYSVGLASQKNYISIYSCAIEDGEYLPEKYNEELGKVSIGRSCIRYKKFEDIQWKTLEKLLKESQDIALKRGIF